MSDCQPLRPVLSRVAEGEASPGEVIRTARHLPDCTACRIHVARERRLALMLEEGLDDPLHVGEEFVRDVMRNIPHEPPPPREQKRRPILKLAGFVALLATGPFATVRALRFEEFGSWLPSLGDPDLAAAERLLAALTGVVRSLPVALDSVSTSLPSLHATIGFLSLATLVAATGFVALGCAGTILAVATTGWIRAR